MAKDYYKTLVILIALIFVNVSCQSIGKKEYSFNSNVDEKDKYFYHDLEVIINGKKFKGHGIIDPAPYYQIKIVKAKGKLDVIRVSTCAGEAVLEDKGWSEEFRVGLASEIETKGSCVFRISAYEKGKGRHSWFIGDFKNPNKTLPIKTLCNGWPDQFLGVGLCESAKSLWQVVEFPYPVRVYQGDQPKECEVFKPAEGNKWEFRVARGECIYSFLELQEPFREGYITFVGYDEILMEAK